MTMTATTEDQESTPRPDDEEGSKPGSSCPTCGQAHAPRNPTPHGGRRVQPFAGRGVLVNETMDKLREDKGTPFQRVVEIAC